MNNSDVDKKKEGEESKEPTNEKSQANECTNEKSQANECTKICNTVVKHCCSCKRKENEKNEKLTSGSKFKAALKRGIPKIGLFGNSCSAVVMELLASCGYHWILIDTQHASVDRDDLGNLIRAIQYGGAKAFVRVSGYHDREGIQQALDLGADGILMPYINSAQQASQAVSCTKYPPEGTRSVYYPQRCMNNVGLVDYVQKANSEVIVALQVETASCIKNLEEIVKVPGIDILLLGQNDLSMSMGLWQKYKFPDLYFSPELKEATQKLVRLAKENNIILGIFLWGTKRVKEFIDEGFTLISLGNDLHHIVTQTEAYMKDLDCYMKEKD